MTVLGSIVEAFVRSVFDAWSYLGFGRAVGSELVVDEPLRCAPLLLHQPIQQAFRCILISPRLKDFIQNNAVLIHSAPQPELPTFEVPLVS